MPRHALLTILILLTHDSILQGHPPELSDSVKLLLPDAKRHGFEIDQVLKSID